MAEQLNPNGSPVGASLLAKAIDQSTSMLNVKPLSRAGSLPHGAGAGCQNGAGHSKRRRSPVCG
ncbi:hypothetical protein EVS84_18240 [Pseudomonas koreensis]|uniref:Uncharacterized protein n=1 Tax=Pseudomonas koreensis TaxID=198620 RepID=A0A4Q4L5A0_9PSED|nr:hypothetical protein EVS84_18240 [Pseudomonas koreensis]